MCDPISAAATAATIGGTVLNGKEASDTAASMANARNAATMAELGRQKAFGEQSRNIFDTSLSTYDNQPVKLAGAQATAGNAFNGNAPTATQVGSITTTGAPAAVGASEQGRLADTFRTIADRNTAHGNLQGYDQNMFDNNVATTGFGRKIDTIGDISKTSAAVNKTEQQAAYGNAYRPPSGIGDILKTAGTLGSFGAGRGGFGSGGLSPTDPSLWNTSLPSGSFTGV